ncbi:MAG: hypothetical protein ABIG85_06425, partial [Chloroflexota bacterium]
MTTSTIIPPTARRSRGRPGLLLGALAMIVTACGGGATATPATPAVPASTAPGATGAPTTPSPTPAA